MYLFQSLFSDTKIYFFKRRIKIYKKTNNSNLILEKDFNTLGILLLTIGEMILFTMLILIALAVVVFPIVLIVVNTIESPTRMSGLVAIIAAILTTGGVIYSTNKKRRDKKKDNFDVSVRILLQYLVELKRGNYNYKIFKDDLSYIFMNIPNNVLFILSDIQDNINRLNGLCKEEQIVVERVITKEILFLIIHVREYYHIAEADLKSDLEHEKVINDLIVNSSFTRNSSKKQSLSELRNPKDKKH